MCSLTIECVLLLHIYAKALTREAQNVLENVFSYCRMCSLTTYICKGIDERGAKRHHNPRRLFHLGIKVSFAVYVASFDVYVGLFYHICSSRASSHPRCLFHLAINVFVGLFCRICRPFLPCMYVYGKQDFPTAPALSEKGKKCFSKVGFAVIFRVDIHGADALRTSCPSSAGC